MENEEQNQNSQLQLISAITADTQVNILISILEKLNPNVLRSIINNTSEEHQNNLNFKVLKATLAFYDQIGAAFQEEEESNKSNIITPSDY
jgi:hypothetical protein